MKILTKRGFIALLFLSHFANGAECQKPSLQVSGEKDWMNASFLGVSNNGRYVAYTEGEDLFLQTTNGESKVIVKDVKGCGDCQFSQDSRCFVFQRNDSIGIIAVDSFDQIQYISKVVRYRLIPRGLNSNLLLYESKKDSGALVMMDLTSGQQHAFRSVYQYWAGARGNSLVAEMTQKEEGKTMYVLNWIETVNGQVHEIWEGREVDWSHLLLDSAGTTCVFKGRDLANSGHNCIWVYTQGDTRARKVIDEQDVRIEQDLTIGDLLAYNVRDGRVFLMLEQKRVKKKVSGVPVDIWSYKDKRLQSVQLEEETGLDHLVQYKAVVDLKQSRMLRLEYEHEKMLSKVYLEKPMRWVLIESNGGGDVNREWDWNKSALQSVWLMSLEDGTRVPIDSGLPVFIPNSYVLSYRENYVYYYDYRSSSYFSYDIHTRKRENLTGSLLATIWTGGVMSDAPSSKIWPLGVAGYIRDEDAILVYDQHDIYELDAGSRSRYKAVNITGALRGTRDWQIRIEGEWRPVIDKKSEVICSIFDRTDKRRGLRRVEFDSLRFLRDVTLYPQAIAESPVRARDTELYFVMLMTAESAPNIFMTKDFTHYRVVTDVHPERAYNWMTSELVTWILPDGRHNQGILYKPGNFDSHKRYPLLVYFYEQLSDDVNKFFKPELSNGILNMPLYVSHEYLVFEPDIHYKIGWPGRSALEAVVSGVGYLCHRPYVNKDKIGLQGHSWGGFETNYIITHSHLFAAAMSACGVSDFISSYGSIVGDGTSHQVQYEQYQGRIGRPLWESPRLYIENSPVFRVDKVTTPLLMVANNGDEAVPFQQGIEFFTALRRLGKRVWMLQYDGMGHTIFDKASEDLTMRMFQFFNYYLKDELAPAWMTEGVPAANKRSDSGLWYDYSGQKP